jgi:hypothetical protein
MDYSAQLDQLQQRVEQAKSAVQAAASESRQQLRQRIDQTGPTWTRPARTPSSRPGRPPTAPRASGHR